MVICVQGDHLLSVLHEMCAHKNLASYTPGVGDMSRVEMVLSGTGMQEQWGSLAILNEAPGRPARVGMERHTTRPHGLVV